MLQSPTGFSSFSSSFSSLATDADADAVANGIGDHSPDE